MFVPWSLQSSLTHVKTIFVVRHNGAGDRLECVGTLGVLNEGPAPTCCIACGDGVDQAARLLAHRCRRGTVLRPQSGTEQQNRKTILLRATVGNKATEQSKNFLQLAFQGTEYTP